MKHLNQNATAVLEKLIRKVSKGNDIRLEHTFLPDLYLQTASGIVQTPSGPGKRCQIYHRYRVQGKDFIHPQMSFIVLDHNSDAKTPQSKVVILPISWTGSQAGRVETGMEIFQNQVVRYDTSVCQKLCDLAEDWLSAIADFGFLNTALRP